MIFTCFFAFAFTQNHQAHIENFISKEDCLDVVTRMNQTRGSMTTFVWTASGTHVKGVRKSKQIFWNNLVRQIDQKIISTLKDIRLQLKLAFFRKMGHDFEIHPKGNHPFDVGVTILFSKSGGEFILYSKEGTFALENDIRPRYLIQQGE